MTECYSVRVLVLSATVSESWLCPRLHQHEPGSASPSSGSGDSRQRCYNITNDAHN